MISSDHLLMDMMLDTIHGETYQFPTWRMPHVEQELPTLPEHMSSPRSSPICSWVRVARSLVFCVVLCRLLFVLFVLFFFYHYIVNPSSIFFLNSNTNVLTDRYERKKWPAQIKLQWNLYKPNLLGTRLCVRNRQVLNLYRLN